VPISKRRVLSASLLGLLLGFVLPNPAAAQTTAHNEWTWMGGSGTRPVDASGNWTGQPGVYGTLGTPAPGNIPGGRDESATWIDSSGNLWLIGGIGYDASGNEQGFLNDLWEFNPSKNEWTWMGGSSTFPASCTPSSSTTCGQPGLYGTLGTSAVGNIPGGRGRASYWTDSTGNFWLFGGIGYDANQNLGELNDLWKFNPATDLWTWVAGSNTVGSNGGQPGVYGTLGMPAAANIPGGRDSAAVWIDKNDNLWLYGGEGFDEQGNYGQWDDLWEFNPSTNEWVWKSGHGTIPASCNNSSNNGFCGWPAVYGALGVLTQGNTPGSRFGAMTWADSNGNFWLFGGLSNIFSSGLDFALIDQYDLWEFNPSTNNWTWMGGNSPLSGGQSTPIGGFNDGGFVSTSTLGTPAIWNIPASRAYATNWNDARGNFWLFGGIQTNIVGAPLEDLYCGDTWEFNPSDNEWAWMSGISDVEPSFYNCVPEVYGSWGVLDTPANTNIPSGRMAAASWVDKNGNFWLFGGYGMFQDAPLGDVLNDLWVFQPVAPTPVPSFELVPYPISATVSAIGAAQSIATGTIAINVVVADGFDSPVTLTAAADTKDGVLGITGSLNPGTITGAGSSRLTVSVDQTVVQNPGTLFLNITGTSGNISESVPVYVDVTATETPIGPVTNPIFSVAPGIYTSAQTVTISDPWGNRVIYYTTDGTAPTASSPVYVNPITISSTTTLHAILITPAFYQSAVATATYTIAPLAATPTILPDGGTYTSAQSVTLADSTTGATIYYTVNGATPTTNSTQYTGAIAVPSTQTIQAIAVAPGYTSSAVASATYTINSPDYTVAVSQPSLTVTAGQSGTISATVTQVNGFDSAVSFSCSGLPSGASCSFSPSTVTPPGSTSTTLKVSTTAKSAALHRESLPLLPVSALAVAFCCFGWRKRRRLQLLLLLAVSLAGFGLLTSCGGGSASSGGGGGGGSQSVTSTVTVTATSGSLSHTTNFTLTVN
jgi:N-acetylneuraminic acid mutarotase